MFIACSLHHFLRHHSLQAELASTVAVQAFSMVNGPTGYPVSVIGFNEAPSPLFLLTLEQVRCQSSHANYVLVTSTDECKAGHISAISG